MFWLDCGRQYSNLSTFTRLTVDSISCLEFHTCEQVDQTSATWRLLSLEAPKIRSATRVGAFQECEMCPRQASCVHQSLGSPKTCSSKLLPTWYLENRVVLQSQLFFFRLSWKRVNQLCRFVNLKLLMYHQHYETLERPPQIDNIPPPPHNTLVTGIIHNTMNVSTCHIPFHSFARHIIMTGFLGPDGQTVPDILEPEFWAPSYLLVFAWMSIFQDYHSTCE